MTIEDNSHSLAFNLDIDDQPAGHDAERRKASSMLTLGDVQQRLEEAAERLAPVDTVATVDRIVVDFTDGPARAAMLKPGGGAEDLGVLSRHALGQLGRLVLPSHGMSTIRELVRQDLHGQRLATAVWSKFALRSNAQIVLRQGRFGNADVIRGVVSDKYGVYDNLHLVDDLVEQYGTEALVSRFRYDSTGMTVRIVDEEPGLLSPTGMREFWNSEVGKASVSGTGGTFQLWCTNGCGSWSDKSSFNVTHRGDTDSIGDKVMERFDRLDMAVDGTMERFEDAMNTAIDDLFEFVKQELEERVTEGEFEAVTKALTAQPAPYAGEPLLLTAVDAITLAAQDANMWRQRELEQEAERVLVRGLGRADNGRIRTRAMTLA